jgi:hypothetical protein
VVWCILVLSGAFWSDWWVLVRPGAFSCVFVCSDVFWCVRSGAFWCSGVFWWVYLGSGYLCFWWILMCSGGVHIVVVGSGAFCAAFWLVLLASGWFCFTLVLCGAF